MLGAATSTAALEFTPENTIEFECDLLPPPLNRPTARSRLPATRVRVWLALPCDFHHERVHPLVIVNATTALGRHSNRRLAQVYASAAMTAGRIVLAADPTTSLSQADDDVFLRHMLAHSALSALARHLPTSREWPIALAGFSDRSKIFGYLAALCAFSKAVRSACSKRGSTRNRCTRSAAVSDRFKRIPAHAGLSAFRR